MMYNLKYNFFLILLLIFFIVPTVIFANEDVSSEINYNGTNLEIDDVNIIEDINSEGNAIYISQDGDNNNDGSYNNPKSTFDESNGAIIAASDNNIHKIILKNGTYRFNEININNDNYKGNNLIIEGSGSTIINGSFISNLFNIGDKNLMSPAINITFKNIDFTGSNSDVPAISVYHSYLNIINCSFYNNIGIAGSCIENCYNSTTTVFKSNFYNNGNNISLGAIILASNGYYNDNFVLNNTVHIDCCKFSNNKAQYGSAIYSLLDSSVNNILMVDNSNFTDNCAVLEAGSIGILGSFSKKNVDAKAVTTVKNSLFKNNKAETGSAIYAIGVCELSINDSIFSDNCATGNLSPDLTVGAGGALSLRYGSTKINNSTFINNSASKGGAIYNVDGNDIVIRDSKFLKNNAIMGGAVYLNNDRDYNKFCLFDNLTFNSNKGTYGESLFLNDLNKGNNATDLFFNITNSKFTNNNIYNIGNLGLVNDSLVNSNTYNGGVININNILTKNSEIITVYSCMCNIISNVSGHYGENVTIKAILKNSNGEMIDSDMIYFEVGINTVMAKYNPKTGYYEANYMINTIQNYSIIAKSLLINNLSSNTVHLNVLKYPVMLDVKVEDTYENGNLNISVYLNSDKHITQGVVTVKINNKSYTIPVKDGYGFKIFENQGLNSGKNIATAIFGVNSLYYYQTSNSAEFYVLNKSVLIIDSLDGAIVTINNISGYVGDNVDILFEIKKDNKIAYCTKPIQLKIDNKLYDSTFDFKNNNYKSNFNIEEFKNYTITVDKFSGTLTVLRHSTTLDINISDVYYDDDITVNVILKSDLDLLDGKVVLFIAGKLHNIEIEKGRGFLLIKDHLKVGSYLAEAEYVGSNIYENSYANSTFNVKSRYIETSIIGKNISMYYKDGTRYEITLVDSNQKQLANQKISIFINGMQIDKTTDKDGKASIAVNLNSGKYPVKVVFNGTNIYNKSCLENMITVLATIKAEDVTKIFKNNTQYHATFYDKKGNLLKNVEVSFNINGVLYHKNTNNNGVASLNINLNSGFYILTAINPITNEMASSNINVLPSIYGNDLVMYFRNGSQYSARFLNSDGTPLINTFVKFNINGVMYEKLTDNNGIARLSINLNPKTYIITAINPINGEFNSDKITILPKLIGEDLNMEYNDGSFYKVKLLDNHGKPVLNKTVKMNINGVFYNKVTNSDGIANLTIRLMPGKYIITSYYEYSVWSNKITVNKI